MKCSTADKCRVTWTRSDGETVVISEHATRDAAELAIKLIRGGCDSKQLHIEPEPAKRKQPS